MTIANTKRKLKVLSLQGVQQVIYDVLRLLANDMGDWEPTAEEVTGLINQLKNQYYGEIPKKQSYSRQTDLEDAIRIAKGERTVTECINTTGRNFIINGKGEMIQ